MAIGNIVGEGIQGFFEGKDWREGRDARRDDRRRQTRMDELIFAREGRDVEEHRARMAAIEVANAERARLEAERKAMADIYSSAAAATDASLGAVPAPAPATAPSGGATSVSTSGAAPGMPGIGAAPAVDPVTGIALNLGLPPPAAAPAGNPQQQFQSDMAALLQPVPPAPVGPAQTAAAMIPPSGAALSYGLGAAPLPAGRRPVEVPGTSDSPADAPRPDRPYVASEDPTVRMFDEQIALRQAELSTLGFSARDSATPGKEDAFEASQAAIARLQQERAQVVDALNARNVAEGRTGPVEVMPTPVPQTRGPQPLAFGAVQPASPTATPAPRRDAAPGSTTQDEKRLAAGAATTLATSQSPAVAATDAAAAAAGDASLGAVRGAASRGNGLSDAKREVAARDWLSHYAEVGAPMVIEAMLSQGNLEGAIRFQEFMDTAQSKTAMQNWAEAAIAAQIGDMDTFAEKVVETYNNADYFGDGMSIVDEGTGFSRDEAGNITGAVVTFRNDESGQTFEQVFNDPQDMVNFGLVALSPEEAFKHYAEQAAAQTTAGVAARKAQEEAAAEQQKRIDTMADTIMSNTNDTNLTMADAMAQATAIVTGQPAPGAAGDPAAAPPVLRRP